MLNGDTIFLDAIQSLNRIKKNTWSRFHNAWWTRVAFVCGTKTHKIYVAFLGEWQRQKKLQRQTTCGGPWWRGGRGLKEGCTHNDSSLSRLRGSCGKEKPPGDPVGKASGKVLCVCVCVCVCVCMLVCVRLERETMIKWWWWIFYGCEYNNNNTNEKI